jgi:DNA (cytosine-5)-methyltransferase 1
MVYSNAAYTFVDLFSGIGGFHLAFDECNATCVWASEWDKHARMTYEANFKMKCPQLFENDLFAGDITKVNPQDIPNFDILTAGFPCQPFSQAGLKKGFEEVRGTLFFNIAEILRVKKPKAFFLENVRGLLTHNNGETFKTIQKVIEDLGYSFFYKVVKASDYGLPTHRPRLFMIGFKNKKIKFKFPENKPLKFDMACVLKGKCDKKIGYTLRVGGKGSGIHDRRNWDSYLVDGNVRRLSVEEAKMMMGFPENYNFPVSQIQAMKQLGNSVAIDAIKEVAAAMIKALENTI